MEPQAVLACLSSALDAVMAMTASDARQDREQLIPSFSFYQGAHGAEEFLGGLFPGELPRLLKTATAQFGA